ncbi:class I SAM-dependent methyltransferase [Pseudomonadota bacterium]
MLAHHYFTVCWDSVLSHLIGINQRFPKFYEELPFPEKPHHDYRYYFDNPWFTYSDAIFLYSFLRKNTPKRIIEVGSGFSSVVMLDTVDNFFSFKPEITFIEPFPQRLKSLLKDTDKDNVTIIEKFAQDVSPSIFLNMEAGDLLFIDSCHVVKCGSDLHILMFDILPLLPKGVFVHFHDIFYPFEYPIEWVKQGRYWNENYFLRAFLSYNSEWSVYFFNTYVAITFNDFIKEKMPLCLKNRGGSLYIQRQ